MKKIWILSVLMFSMLSCKTQKDLKNNISSDYTSAWQEIDENIKKGFPEKAITGLDSLISRSRENSDEITATQAVLRKLNLKNLDQEDFMKKQMAYLIEELAKTKDETAKSFMQYTLALIYHNYWDSNLSEIPAKMTGDSEWGGEDYRNAIDSLLYLTLTEDNKQLKISEISQFFLKKRYEESTTLWDYFMSEKIALIKKRTYEGLLGEEEVRTLIRESYALFISKLDKQKQDKIALETRIEASKYLGEDLVALKGSFPEKIEYIYNYHLGEELYQESQRKPGKEAKSELLVECMGLFETVKSSQDSIYSNNAQVAIDNILRQDLKVSTEQVILPNKPALVYVSTKNLEKIYVKVYQLSEKDYIDDRREKGFPYKSRTIVHEEEIDLPETKFPYTLQSTEISIPSLGAGFYGIVVNTSNDFSIGQTNPLYQHSFLVSSLSINYFLDRKRNKMILECVDRSTGKVIENAEFVVYDRVWNSGRGDRFVPLYEGLGNPSFSYTSSSSKNLFPYVKKGDSYFFLKNGLNENFYTSAPTISGSLFTDRGIYRPGQEVHFQGILYYKSYGNEPQVVKSTKFNLNITDNFGTELAKLDLESDLFGSYSGIFQIPDNIQNGNLNFRLSADRNSQLNVYQSVRIEEYKRPKFEVSFEEINQSLEIGKQVKVSASAISFTGVPVIKSKVRYKIYRDYWIPYFCRGYSSYFPSGGRELIASGEGLTDQEGKFDFDFMAKASLSDQSKSYTFSVDLEVVDNTGETIAAEKSFRVSDQALYLKFDKIDGSNFKIGTVNSENAGLASGVELVIYKKSDMGYKVDRYWPFPDTSTVDQGKFSNFSFQRKEDLYPEEVYNASFVVKESVILNLKDILGSGEFKIVLKAKGAITFEEYFDIIDFDKEVFNSSKLFFLSDIEKRYEPGELVNLSLGSSVNDLQVHVSVYQNQKLVQEKWHSVDGKLALQFPTDTEDYGGFSILLRAFYKNRIIEETIDINIPREHKELFIKPKTIRLVTEPGASEKWTFVVTDKDGNPVKSRVLSSMYDASLDQFEKNQWAWNPYMNYTGVPYFQNYSYSSQYLYTSNYRWNQTESRFMLWKKFPDYRFSPQQFYAYAMQPRMMKRSAPMAESEGISMAGNVDADMAATAISTESDLSPEPSPLPPPPAVRTNLSELVFFYPDLETDENGEVTIEFKNNEALTKWHFQNFAFTEDLKYGFFSEEIITKKELMIQANQARFMRAGDKISLSAKIINLSETEQIVKADLNILDELTKKSVKINNANGRITLAAGGQTEVFWELTVPDDVRIVKLTYSVEGEKHTDAEQHVLPIMPSEIYLINTETVLLDGNSKTKIDFQKLREGGMRSDALTIESTGSPAWYAMRSLPYLMEQDRENAEAIFNRYFANALGLKILDENPMLEKYYREWEANGNLKSQLKMNEELKKVDLDQTPWLRNAISEEEVMKKMAELFQRGRIEFELITAAQKLRNMQLGDGSFPWYRGGRSNYYMSQYILEGILKLDELGIEGFDENMINRLFNYCAAETQRIYDSSYDYLAPSVIRNVWISVMMKRTASASHKVFVDKMKTKLKDKWYEYGLHSQIYISSMFMDDDLAFSNKVASSLLEKSFYKEQLGRFWNSNSNNIYSSWDISLQADMISLFNKLGKNDDAVDEMKFWLVTNKRTHSWSSPIATSAAIYALSLGKSSSFTAAEPIIVKVDQEVLKSDAKVGINYQVERITNPEKLRSIKEISFENVNKNKGWANVHHQFFQDYDDVERTENDYFDLKKEIYKVGSENDLVNIEGKTLQLGDRIRVRLIVNSDRPMQFVHIKDDRPAGAEPADLESGYHWQGRLGYYKSIKDIASHFFIDALEKGKYVVEYDMFINNLGDFNAGVAEIQNVYAPEFNDYSKSVRIQVK